MVRPLTLKQDTYAHKVAEGWTLADAYRFAYDAEGMSPESLYVAASKLASNDKVALRVSELRSAAMASAEVTVHDVVRGLHEIATDESAPPSARVSAWLGLAKRHPEFSDKHDIKVDQRTQALMAVSQMPLEQLLALAEGVEAADD